MVCLRRLLLVLGVLGSACARPNQQAPRAAEPPWTPNVSPSEPAVARVNGVPLYATELRAHVRATGLPARAALEDLIAQESLAQEARRRGLWRDSDVGKVREAALVRRFVVVGFGASTRSPQVIPEADARPVFERSVEFFQHGTLLRVLNVCTTEETARRIYEDARRKAPRSAPEFVALAARNGGNAQSVFTAEDSRKYAPSWRKAVFAALRKTGDVMPPTPLPELPFPCKVHVAYCEEFIPPVHIEFAQALSEVRKRMYEDWRRKSFWAYLAGLTRAHQIAILEEPAQ